MWKMQAWIFFVILWSSGHSFKCMDPNGHSVDWYSVYKMPEMKDASDWKLRDGLAHFYLDVNSPKWTLSKRAMNETQHAVVNTLNQIYGAVDVDFLHIMYNDEPPEEAAPSDRGGHTKGVVACDDESGFWLIHSTPKFPPVKNERYMWPHSALDFGQTFLCISFPYLQLDNVAKQLFYNEPHIYDKQVPRSFCEKFPNLQNLIDHKSPPYPWKSVVELTSCDGQNFTVFAKAGKLGADLYDNLVAPTLQQDILVETWLRTKGTELPSNCSAEYKVIRVQAISFPAENNISFNETHDHAKWAVTSRKNFPALKFKSEMSMSDSSDARWTCIGDINRMKSQFHRGGGTACLKNTDVWAAYRDIISQCQNCSETDYCN